MCIVVFIVAEDFDNYSLADVKLQETTRAKSYTLSAMLYMRALFNKEFGNGSFLCFRMVFYIPINVRYHNKFVNNV